MMKKFPVTSAKGNEYLAKVGTSDTLIGNMIEVRLYKKTKKKVFWYEKEVFVHLHTNYYRGEDVHKYVKAVKDTVAEYEYKIQKELELEIKNKQAHEENLKQFNEWDGVC